MYSWMKHSYIYYFSHNTTRSWMFRHSDGNKNSAGRRKRLIKPFCPFTTTTADCLFKKRYIFFWKMCFFLILLWSHGCGSQNSGIPTELPRLTFASSYGQICPLLRICQRASDTLFELFWPEFVTAKSSYSSRQSFPVSAQTRMLHNGVFHLIIRPAASTC